MHWRPERIWLQPKPTPLTLRAETTHLSFPMAHPTMMRPWLTGIISTVSGNEHTLANGLFPSPLTSLQRKKVQRERPLGSVHAFSPSFPKHPLLSPQDQAWFLNSHQVSGEGKYYFLHFCWRRNWCYLSPIVLSTHPVWTWLKAEWRCTSSCVPYPLEQCSLCTEIPIQSLFPFTQNIGSKLSTLPKWESMNVLRELLSYLLKKI